MEDLKILFNKVDKKFRDRNGKVYTCKSITFTKKNTLIYCKENFALNNL